MTVLSAGVFAASSFAAMNAYAAGSSCLVCWSPDATLCDDMNQPGTSAGYVPGTPLMDVAVPVMWLSCYERHFRNGITVDETTCGETFVHPKYETWIDFPDDIPGDPGIDFPDDGKHPADNAWWYPDMNCADLRREGYIQDYVPRAADSLDYTDICLVRNDGLNNETVSGIGILAPGATGLLPGACPAN